MNAYTVFYRILPPGPPSFFRSPPNSSSTFSHLCIQGCIPRFSTIWRLNSSLLVAMKGMLNTALMCNLSLHKHYRSRPTPGINATDLSYTSRAQLEDMGGWGVAGCLRGTYSIWISISIGLYANASKLIFSLAQAASTQSAADKTRMHFIEEAGSKSVAGKCDSRKMRRELGGFSSVEYISKQSCNQTKCRYLWQARS